MAARRWGDSDSDLARRAQDGEAAAFDELFARYRDRLQGVGRRWFGDGWLSQEVVEETRLRAWQHRAQLRDPAAVGGWLLGIAHHYCYQRHRAGQPEIVSLSVEHLAVLPATGDPAAQVADELAVAQLLRSLPTEQRDVVELCLVAGLTREEAAARLGVSTTVVKGRLQRARVALRKELAP